MNHHWMRAFLAVALAAAFLPASAAHADSLVFINGGNVWLANPDGSSRYQVTLDGTPSAPYGSPSQADDGTIVAVRQGRLFRMKQNGAWLNEPITTAAIGTGPLHPAVSPDGRLVAFDYGTVVNGGFRTQVLYTYADRFTEQTEIDPAGFSLSDPSWLDNSRTMLFSGTQVWTDTTDASVVSEWWSDVDHGFFEQLHDGETVGNTMVLVRGDDRETLQFYTRQGTDYTSDPLPGCWFSGPTGEFADPTLSPGAATVAWQENDGIWLSQVPASTDCERAAPRLEIPGASEPDFGPANVNPGPRPVVEPPRAPGPGPAPGPRGCCEPPADTTAPTLTLITRKTLKLRALLAGLKVSYRCSESCSTSASLRLDRRVAQRLRLPRTVAAGSSAAVTTGNVVLTPTRRAKRVLPRLPTVTMTLLVTARDGARNATSEQQRIVVRR